MRCCAASHESNTYKMPLCGSIVVSNGTGGESFVLLVCCAHQPAAVLSWARIWARQPAAVLRRVEILQVV
eukprot:9741393-Prorocentrum_lima.AAC.1